jgi:hypothetical protein
MTEAARTENGRHLAVYREQKAAQIKRARVKYEKTRNPMYAWSAYLAVRDLGDPVPEWVLSYIDVGASQLWHFLHAGKEPIDSLAQAFGFKEPTRGRGRPKGGGNLFAPFKESRWVAIGWRVADAVAKFGPRKEKIAIQEVVSLWNIQKPREAVSEPTARRAWKRFKREYPIESEIPRHFRAP